MSIRIAAPSAEARRGVDLLRSAQHKVVEAVGILGTNPVDGGLWDALALIAAERAEAEALLARRPRRRRR
jgi:hypothetical protein